MLKIVIPLSSSDIKLLDNFVALFRAFGGAPRQDVYLLPTRGVTMQAKLACEQMQARCKSCSVIEWEKDNAEVQPLAGNFMWQHAVMEMGLQENTGNRQPWYFMELDNTILKAGWADALESEYAMSGCLYMGAVAPSRVKLSDGTITTDVHIPGQPPNIPFMVGTGIYPVNVAKHTQGQWFYAKYESWDKFLKFYTSRSLHSTKLIQHQWKTCNFRKEGDQIICDNDPSNPDKTDNTGPLDPNACIHHGAKDGSLAELVLSSIKTLPTQEAEHAPIVIPQSTEKPEAHGTPAQPKGGWEAVNPKQKATSKKRNPAEVQYDTATWSAFQHKQEQEKEFNLIAKVKAGMEQERLKAPPVVAEVVAEVQEEPEQIEETQEEEVPQPKKEVVHRKHKTKGSKPKRRFNFRKTLTPA